MEAQEVLVGFDSKLAGLLVGPLHLSVNGSDTAILLFSTQYDGFQTCHLL